MAVDEHSLTQDAQQRGLSSDVTQDDCNTSDYNTFEKEEMPDRTKMKNRKMIVITFCVVNLFAGMMYSLVAPFYAVEVSW